MGILRGLRTLPVTFAVIGLAAWGVRAQELLTDGDFEAGAVVPGWSLEETVTGMPGALINSAQQQGFANQPSAITGEFGLWLQPFNGNQGVYLDQNKKTNAILSQTVSGAAGEGYTLTGWSRFEPNYSGGVDFLDDISPSGGIASPTESIWELAFLDASNTAIGSPVTLDLRTVQTFDNTWRQHTLMGTAPAGTASVRVTAAATDMVFNINPNQSGFYDNFSLKRASTPATELLTNASLNELPPELSNWTVTETPAGANTAAIGTFANNPGTGGSVGLWLRGFVAGDAIVSQMVSGVVGGDYTFSAWSAWEQFYTGGLSGTTTETFMELAFLDASDAVIGDALRLNLLNAGQTNAPGPIATNPDAWRQFSLNGLAPEGTVNVRVSVGSIGMVTGTDNPQSAFFDDLSLTLAAAGLVGDYNNDNVVDAADYTVWRDNLGGAGTTLGANRDPNNTGTVSQDDYDAWKNNFGATPGAGSSSQSVNAAVPEPASWMLAMLGSLAAGLLRRPAA